MRSFTLLAVGLAAVSVHAQSVPTTYAAWEALFPSCAKPCLDTLYGSIFGHSCGANAKNSASGLQCICSLQSDPNAAQQAGQTAGTCVVNDCPNADSTTLLNDFGLLATMCENALGFGSGGSSSGAVPSGSPSPSASAGMSSATPSAGVPSASPSASGLPTFSASSPSQTGSSSSSPSSSSSSATAKSAGSSVRVNNREGVALIGAAVAVGAFML